VPPLRERAEDIPLLLRHFLRQAAERSAAAVPVVPEETLAALVSYPWPGNVRELKNAAERLVITAQGGVAGPFEFAEAAERLVSLPATPGRLSAELERTEKTVIESALRETQGEVTAAALALGISRRALYERMKKYGLRKESFRT
jgi:two-component system C4-dicarboxylate transport response regulator DctD